MLEFPWSRLVGRAALKIYRPAVCEGGASAVCIGSMAVFQSKGMGVLIKFPKLSDLGKTFWNLINESGYMY